MSKTVSVVIASGAGGDFLFRCLGSLKEQAHRTSSEVIVADRQGPQVLERIAREAPWVKTVTVETGHRPSVPELRSAGVQAASGDIVAILEEHCVAPDDWIENIAGSLGEGDAAIGGPILDDNYGRIRDWVVYFSEYNNYLPPWRNEERHLLNGANIAYDRNMLTRHTSVLNQGYWEVVLHPLLWQDGRFKAVPEMGVRHTGPFNFGYYLGQRYLLCRAWGGTQRKQVGTARRVFYLLVAPILPVALLARTAGRVLKSGRRMGRFLVAIPLLIPVMLVYVWGEWLGYLLGPGDALEKVE